MKTLIFHDILILSPCAFDPCNDCHARGWSDRKRLGRLGQLHSISFARLREWTRRAGARGFLGSRRFHGRRKRGGLQATSCYRDQAWSHFDVGHHGIHHPSDLDLLKLRLRSFQQRMFLLMFPCLQLHYIVAGSTGSLFLNASRWNNPQEITGKFPGYLSPSAGLKFADVPNGLAAISKVPAAGQGWNNWLHLNMKATYFQIYHLNINIYVYIIYIICHKLKLVDIFVDTR